MAQKDIFRSPDKELDASRYRRDMRTVTERFNEFLTKPDGFMMVMGVMFVLFFALPSFGEFWFVISLFLIHKAKRLNSAFRLPFRMPKSSGVLDPGQLLPGTHTPDKAKGISFIGNERNTKNELWFNDSDMRTHMLIFGTTGAGKTEGLLSIAYNSLVQGSGFFYVDGKGDTSLYMKVFALARTMGREDDLLLVNYMTASRDVFGPQETKPSNTLNPFSSGSSGGLTELVVSLMGGDEGGGGGDMWKGRAVSLISAIMQALVYLRDQGLILLDVETIREHLILDNIIKMYRETDFPPHVKAAVRGYLTSLPGYQEGATKQMDSVSEQHGFCQMQFTRILGSLTDSYGFIFKTNLGEVDFRDVVLNRRILVVLLPALEKSTDELANLGKIIVACLKQMMASALGASIEGKRKEIIDTKPTESDEPFLTILDEYGYYAVKGSAVMAAQARSLGFSMIFAGQDLPAFEKASKEEAASIVANCNIKICMKLEDPQATYELFEKLAGETLTPAVTSGEMASGLINASFTPGKNVNLEFKKRINVLDLKDQSDGEAHILFKSVIVKARLFFANPPKPDAMRINYFVRVEPPADDLLGRMDLANKSILKALTKKDESGFTKPQSMESSQIVDSESGQIFKISSLFKGYLGAAFSPDVASFAATAVFCQEVSDMYKSSTRNFNEVDDDDDKRTIDIFSSSPKRDGNRQVLAGSSYDNEDGDDDDDQDEIDMFLQEGQTRRMINEIERRAGRSEEEAGAISSGVVDEMKSLSKYPANVDLEIRDPDEIVNLLQDLDDMFDDAEVEEN